MNGYLTFNQAFISVNPKQPSNVNNIVLIAPFWADIDLNNYYNSSSKRYLYNQGKIYYSCFSRRTPYSRISDGDRIKFDKVRSQVVNNIDYSGLFTPTSVCKITWVDISPYPYSAETMHEVIIFMCFINIIMKIIIFLFYYCCSNVFFISLQHFK